MKRALCAATLIVCAACEKKSAADYVAEQKPLPPMAKKLESAPPVVSQPVEMKTSAPSVAPVAKAPNLQAALKSLNGNGQTLEGKMGKLGGATGGDFVTRGEAKGMGGLGLKGAGSGGGGTGVMVGIGGIGSAGSIGYGTGHGGLGARKTSAPTVVVSAPTVAGRGFGVAIRSGDVVTNSEDYKHYDANQWTDATQDHLSTFAADVDTASYTVARRKLLEGSLPPPDSVRVEEWLNYFRYHYPQPTTGTLGVSLEAAPSPFADGKTLLRVGVQGKQLAVSDRKTAHLVFLVDVSGSMQSPDKLPLAKRALRMLVDNLRDGDTVSMVTYASGVKLVLTPTPLDQKAKIHAAIEDLHAGGSTAMEGGIELAYQQAVKTLDSQSFSRVIILSDGDANVGSASHEEILKLIAGHVKEGVTVTTVGFGMGNYKDTLMEQFADKGNGNHYYCDSLFEAKRIFVEQLGATLEVIAQDVKFQVDFDSKQVRRYRLVGYENRDVADKDFRNDKVDGGEIGSGHQVTAMYEVELLPGAGTDWAKVHLRAKKPRGTEAAETVFALDESHRRLSFDAASEDFRFATSVMAAAEIFRRSRSAGDWSYEKVMSIAQGATPAGSKERQEFVMLLQQAKALAGQLASR
ncbi:MAG: VWA domain-containing protein [Myxococcaceae bacterium]